MVPVFSGIEGQVLLYEAVQVSVEDSVDVTGLAVGAVVLNHPVTAEARKT